MSDAFFGGLAAALADNWRRYARPEQLAPEGNWHTWLVMAGRGFGKTRTGAEWVHEQVALGARRLAIVGPTAGDVRDTMVEGKSGLLATAPQWARPEYEPSKRRLTWGNGAVATCFSAEEPERLRGPEHAVAWCDEVGSWQNQQDTWDMMQMGLRLGSHPRALVTTTPRPTPVIRKLLSEEARGVVVTRGRTQDNAANLPEQFIRTIEGRYGGTRLGRQELNGELLEDTPGALWQREWIDRDRADVAPDLISIVVAIDPAVTNHEGSDETGIIVAGRGRNGHVYVLEDDSARRGPAEWAKAAIRAYERHEADRIIAEVNNGGLMVAGTIRMVDSKVPFTEVRASRGKVVRAEPVSALYEQGKVHHVGCFATLEDQMCSFTSDFDRSRAGYSPDRVDALVWAVSFLSTSSGFSAALLNPATLG